MKRPDKRSLPAKVAVEARETELTIGHMAAGGDGAAVLPDGQSVFVPYTLPGERVRAAVAGPRGRLIELVEASAERVEPPCPHFGSCGGCAVQHWADAPYADWKRDVVRRALARAGYPDAVVGALRRTPPAARRRMDFAAQRTSGGMALGLNAAHSLSLVSIDTCTILHPLLERLLGPLREVLTGMGGIRRGADVAANVLDNGVDLLIRADAEATATDRVKLAAFAAAQGVSRVTWSVGQGAPETAALVRVPVLRFAGVEVAPPPGAFLQASAEGEAAIVEAVLAGLPAKMTGRARIVELFAGAGTLSFPLATRGRVIGYEGDAPTAAALRKAAGGTRVEAVTRDLVRQPLQAKELAGAACVVLDPPYTGAGPQMGPLAASRVPVVVIVSCNPAALSRDAAILREAGYRLVAVTPVDQFLWSSQIEAVCVFALQ
jgi:23S rRNA (uracil1939-C5)-methyltransferase